MATPWLVKVTSHSKWVDTGLHCPWHRFPHTSANHDNSPAASTESAPGTCGPERIALINPYGAAWSIQRPGCTGLGVGATSCTHASASALGDRRQHRQTAGDSSQRAGPAATANPQPPDGVKVRGLPRFPARRSISRPRWRRPPRSRRGQRKRLCFPALSPTRPRTGIDARWRGTPARSWSW
jgi:hypothetical protein